MIPYGHQAIDREDIDEVIKVLKSDWLTQGPKIKEFEKTLTKYCGAKYAVVVSNGTAALHLAYLTAGLKSGDEVVTTPNTFIATSNMLLAVGAKPIFCDIKANTYNINEDKIEKLITNLSISRQKKIKAIVPVHFAGHPCEMEKIAKIAKKYNLLIIEDACHSLGAKYKNLKIGSCSHSDMAVFSFHPVKSITTGEGGAILTNNKKYYEKLKILRNHGITKKNFKFKRESDGDWYYEMQCQGYNYRMTDIQAALGVSQCKKIDQFIEARKKIVNIYAQTFKDYGDLISLPSMDTEQIASAWHLYVIRMKGKLVKKRAEIFAKLKKAGIGVQVHYIPVYFQPYYRLLGYKKGLCPQAEDFYKSAISLPIYPNLKLKNQRYVIKCILSLLT